MCARHVGSVHGHLSVGSLVRGFTCLWFWGSLVRGFTCPGFTCSEVHLSGDSLVRTFRQFGVATPRGSHSLGDAALLKYIRAMLLCWSIVGKLPPRFPLYLNFCYVVIY